MLVLVLLLSSAVADLQQEIEELEKEKNSLHLQISDAVDDIEIALTQAGNGSEAQQQLELLKGQVEALAGTDVSEDDGDAAVDPLGGNKTRRSEDKKKPKKVEEKKKNNGYDEEFSIAHIYGSSNSKKRKHRMANRDLMQKKLEQWILDRGAKKQKIEDIRVSKGLTKAGHHEHCPQLGVDKKRARKGKGGGRASGKYPCCRKCCKHSYLGCL